MPVAIHVTHEAIQKFGGIGSVLQGLITSPGYSRLFEDTLLYTPLFNRDSPAALRLGENTEMVYSGIDSICVEGEIGGRLLAVEQKYHVEIVCGKKRFFHTGAKRPVTVDVVAVDIWQMDSKTVDAFKFRLWEFFGIASDRFQHDHDYEQYLRIGIVLREVFEAIYGTKRRAVVFSHEYMGLPSAFAFESYKRKGERTGDVTLFYAHEVSTARVITESHSGHDLTFYNVLNLDRDTKTSMETTFGSFSGYSRNELVRRASELDYIFAVSDMTREELIYLCPHVDEGKIKVVYNGISVDTIDGKDKLESRARIQQYCENLYNFTPDILFTHVTRLIRSKALWRDIRFLYHLDEHLHGRGQKGFFVILSTLVGTGRPADEIFRMETEYGWPVIHREGWPDLVGPEIDLYHFLEIFNARSKAIKGVFINQFGFDPERCGVRIPKGTTVTDLRYASDMEFGLSIYEPFGIAQIENLPYGGLPVFSNACGCVSLVKTVIDPQDYLSVDFVVVPTLYRDLLSSKESFLDIHQDLRDRVETEICLKGAGDLIAKLPTNDKERLSRLKRMQQVSTGLDWSCVVKRIKAVLGAWCGTER